MTEAAVSYRKIIAAILVAAILWMWMFSPLTTGLTDFWLTMTFSACVLTVFALILSGGKALDPIRGISARQVPRQLLCGTAIAFALWGVFWVGDKLSSLMFDFAREQVDDVYSMKQGLPSWAIALLLLFIIGPAEEFFWRGFVQRFLCDTMVSVRLACRKCKDACEIQSRFCPLYSRNLAFVVTTLVYALVHIPSLNFMLVMAALTAGAVWGLIYRLNPKLLPALMVSHALWDALVFVIFPI